MRETIRRFAGTQKRFSSACRAFTAAARVPAGLAVTVPAIVAAVLALIAAPATAQESAAATLSSISELEEVERALGELSERVDALEEQLSEQSPAELEPALEDVRADLESWADILPQLEVAPEDDSEIDRRRYRRFERRVERTRSDINAAVERVNAELEAAAAAGQGPSPEADTAPEASPGAVAPAASD